MQMTSGFWGKQEFAFQLELTSVRRHECIAVSKIQWLWIWNTGLTSNATTISPIEEKWEKKNMGIIWSEAFTSLVNSSHDFNQREADN